MVVQCKKSVKDSFTKGKLYQVFVKNRDTYTVTDDTGWENHSIAEGDISDIEAPTWFNKHFRVVIPNKPSIPSNIIEDSGQTMIVYYPSGVIFGKSFAETRTSDVINSRNMEHMMKSNIVILVNEFNSEEQRVIKNRYA